MGVLKVEIRHLKSGAALLTRYWPAYCTMLDLIIDDIFLLADYIYKIFKIRNLVKTDQRRDLAQPKASRTARPLGRPGLSAGQALSVLSSMGKL